MHTVFDWVRLELADPNHVVQRVRSYVYELVIWHEVAAAISQRHFQGYDVLLSDYRKELDDLKQFAEDELLRFNDQLDFLDWRKKERRKRGPKLPQPIDWETLRTEVQGEAARRVSELVEPPG